MDYTKLTITRVIFTAILIDETRDKQYDGQDEEDNH